MTTVAIFDRLSALADPIRGRLLLALEGHELTVREIQAALQLPQSTVSRHLKVLAELGLVVTRSEGTSNWYRMPGNELAAAPRRLWLAIREEVAESPAARRDSERLRPILARRHLASQRFFASAAGQWDKLRAELFGADSSFLALPGLLDESWTVGDLGCGTGHLIPVLAPFVRRVIGVDESEAMLAAARERTRDLANVELRPGSLEDPPLRRGELDAALLLLVLHHAPDPGRVLAAAQRALKPGGKLLLLDMQPHEHTGYREQMGHQWLGFSESELGDWLERAGFARTRWVPMTPDPQAKGPALFAMTAIRPILADRTPLTAQPSRGLT
jgi:SAM-dependent methyltransferase